MCRIRAVKETDRTEKRNSVFLALEPVIELEAPSRCTREACVQVCVHVCSCVHIYIY